MTVKDEAERAIGAALSRYCRTFDNARFDEFAALFERGRWFMVPEPGRCPVRDWIHHHVVLYDGQPLTHHTVSDIVVGTGDGHDQAAFSCRIKITQQLSGEDERLLALARFTGTFHKEDGRWWWCDHSMYAEKTGDLSTHIKAGVPA